MDKLWAVIGRLAFEEPLEPHHRQAPSDRELVRELGMSRRAGLALDLGTGW